MTVYVIVVAIDFQMDLVPILLTILLTTITYTVTELLYGMDRRDVVPNINFFCNVPVDTSGQLADTVFVESRSRPGDYVELRAEMRALALISNCPQVNNPCNDGRPSPIRVEILN